MTELLIVIGLIVLLLAMAIPAFSFITGSKSVDGAVNQISAFLGRARSEAIGLQEVRGLMFFLDPSTDRVTLAMVKQAVPPRGGIPANDPLQSQVDVYLDLVPDVDFLPLPPGVSAQFVDDAFVNNTGVRQDDGYIGFNSTAQTSSGNDTRSAATPSTVPYGGVILFDGNGRLISRTFAFRTRTPDPGSNPPTFTLASDGNATAIGRLLYRGSDLEKNGTIHTIADLLPWQKTTSASNNTPLRSQFGFVLFDRESFKNAGGTDVDPELSTNTTYTANSNAEPKEETWLDTNASPVLVNRYNGTVIRGE